MEQIAKQQGVKLVHVPFKGNAETTTALLGGHIDAVADSTGWAPQINDGKFRLNAALADPQLKGRLADLGGTVIAGSPSDFGSFIAAEAEKWGKVIRAANIKAE
jgi:tripartite-type tricarboxylate transporter receptor subunit TctC